MDSHSPPPTVSICQVESNLPGEDRYCIRVTEDIYTYGVYDGHGGYLAADMACAMLQDMIIAEISLLNTSERTDLKIASIINTSFCSCDEKIVAEALNLHTSCRNSSFSAKSLSAKGIDKFGSKVSPPTDPILSDVAYMLERQVVPKIMGRAGSCAAIVVITGGMIFVAHVGDCRVVLIRDENESTSMEASSEQKSEGVFTDDEESRRKRQKIDYHESDPKCFKKYDSLLNTFQPDNEDGRSLRRRESIPRDFGSVYRGIVAEGITLDHNCDIQSEAEAVGRLTSDPNPIRCSDSDRKSLGSRAPLRVAGSLAVTRAFGDSYLKIGPLSTQQYVQYIPYISCKPSIHYRALRPADKSIIIASDGLWNFLKARDCAKIMEKHLSDLKNEVRIELLRNPSSCKSFETTEKKIREMDRIHELDFNRIPKMAQFSSGCDDSAMLRENGIERISDDDDVIMKMSHESSNNIHSIEEKDVQIFYENNILSSDLPVSQDVRNNNNSNTNNNNNENNNSIDDDDSNSLNSKSSSNEIKNINKKNKNNESNPQNSNFNYDDVTTSNIQKGSRPTSERKKKEMIKCNKVRSTKVVWANKNIENLNFLFTLDSHVPTEALNIYSGFSPLVTATANVAVSTTKSNYTEMDDVNTDSMITKKLEIISRSSVYDDNNDKNNNNNNNDNNNTMSVIERDAFNDQKLSQNSSTKKVNNSPNVKPKDNNDNDVLKIVNEKRKNEISPCNERTNVDNKKNSDDCTKRDCKINVKNEHDSNNMNKNKNEKKNEYNNEYKEKNQIEVESNMKNFECITPTNAIAFSSIKLSCNIGENHKYGAFVSHQIVRNNDSDSAEHSNDILQIQAKACAGFETRAARLAATPGHLPPNEVLSYNVHPGNMERKNKELEKEKEKEEEKEEDERERRSNSHPSIFKEKDKIDENDVNFMGDFLFDYYTSKTSTTDHSKFRRMKISINQGPALTLMDRCLEMAASNSKICSTGKELRNVPQGTLRRGLVDDITIVVLTF